MIFCIKLKFILSIEHMATETKKLPYVAGYGCCGAIVYKSTMFLVSLEKTETIDDRKLTVHASFSILGLF